MCARGDRTLYLVAVSCCPSGSRHPNKRPHYDLPHEPSGHSDRIILFIFGSNVWLAGGLPTNCARGHAHTHRGKPTDSKWSVVTTSLLAEKSFVSFCPIYQQNKNIKEKQSIRFGHSVVFSLSACLSARMCVRTRLCHPAHVRCDDDLVEADNFRCIRLFGLLFLLLGNELRSLTSSPIIIFHLRHHRHSYFTSRVKSLFTDALQCQPFPVMNIVQVQIITDKGKTLERAHQSSYKFIFVL